MNKFFGIPILIAFFLGYQFPYFALTSSTFAFYILMLMMCLTMLTFDLSILKKIKEYPQQILIGTFSLYIIIPLIQWLLASYFIKENSFAFGIFFAALCPIAIVSPMFTKYQKGNVELSFLFMILSTFLFPFTTLVSLYLLKSNSIDLKLQPILIDSLLLIIAPLIISVLIKKILPQILPILKRVTPHFNMYAIAFMAFVYFGASMSKLNIYYTSKIDLVVIIAMMFFQDFIIYFVSKWYFLKIFNKEDAISLAVSISMKNIAIAGGMLLFYDPKASLASAIGFLVHAFFYNYLSYNAD